MISKATHKRIIGIVQEAKRMIEADAEALEIEPFTDGLDELLDLLDDHVEV